MWRRTLVAAAALATVCNAGSAPVVHVGSFPELQMAVSSGAPAIEITARKIVFDQQLYVPSAETALLIESTIDATLSGGDETRLFFLQNGSKLSLRGVRLERGVARASCTGCFAYGGAIYVSSGGELRLHSTHLLGNHADALRGGGGAVYAVSSTVTATNCTMTVNSAPSSGGGGAIWAEGASTVIATKCTMTSNSAGWGGAVYVGGRSTFTATDCVMSSNSVSGSGGAIIAFEGSTVTATDCTMTSNSASWAGAVAATGVSTVTVANCTMASNSASWGGAVGAKVHSILIVTDCTMASNRVVQLGGAVVASDHAKVMTVNCTMASNFASFNGGAIIASGDSAVTAADCTMASNVASFNGGAIIASGAAVVTATDCTMASNSASFNGGAIVASGAAVVTTTDCTMTSNSALWGGAVVAFDRSNFTATNCTIISNFADLGGGAVVAAGDSTVTTTDCTMTSNAAFQGGAVLVSPNVSVAATGCMMTVANCVLSLNSASSGGSILVRKGGTVDLVASVFHFNIGNDTNDGVGIVNLNGQVQCDAIIGCLPVCTVCGDGMLSLPPTTQPTLQTHKRKTKGLAMSPAGVDFLVVVCLFGVLGSVFVMNRCCKSKFFGGDLSTDDDESEGVEVLLRRPPLTDDLDDVSTECGSANHHSDPMAGDWHTPPQSVRGASTASHDEVIYIERDMREQSGNRASLPWSAIGSSPAPIFAIDHEMRIVSWSPGACVNMFGAVSR